MFDLPYPKDLPSCCPECGKQFRSKVNLEIGPGKVSRFLKALAYGMIVPWMIIAIVVLVTIGFPNGGFAGGYAIVGIRFIPPALIALMSVLFPISRRINCSCGWQKDYSIIANKTKEEA